MRAQACHAYVCMSLFAFLVIRVFPGVCCYFLHLAADALGSMIARTEHFHPHLALALSRLSLSCPTHLLGSPTPGRQATLPHVTPSLRHYLAGLPPGDSPRFLSTRPHFQACLPDIPRISFALDRCQRPSDKEKEKRASDIASCMCCRNPERWHVGRRDMTMPCS